MESSRNRLKSLKDSLLEYTVMNMEILVVPRKSKDDELSAPIFPRNLFDEIWEKGKDICWPISIEERMQYFANKDRLKWSETSFFSYFSGLPSKDLKHFAGSMHAIKTLVVDVSLDQPVSVNCFKHISKAACSLDYLNISIEMSERFKRKCLNKKGNYAKCKTNIGTLNPLKLKRLALEADSLHHFPFTLDSDMLTVLDIFVKPLTKSILETLTGFKRLVHLSLCSSNTEASEEKVIDTVTSFKSLRFLSLLAIRWLDEFMLNDIITNLDKLEVLEVENLSFYVSYKLLIPRKKLKVLNYLELDIIDDDMYFSPESVLNNLAERIGNLESLEGLLTIVSTTPTWRLHEKAIEKLFTLMQDERKKHELLVEAEKRDTYIIRSPMKLDEALLHGPCSGTSCDVLYRIFMFHLFYLESDSRQMELFNDYAKNNKNTYLAQTVARYLMSGRYRLSER